jgi:hypothetical protein
MADSPRTALALAPVHRSLSVEQPERSEARADSQRRAAVVRRAREQQRRARARQHALVSAWLRELTRKQS